MLGAEDPNIISDYFFRPYGADRGWRFDNNFEPEGAWQKTVHHAAQTDIVVIGGFGTGKTSGVAISACVWAISKPWFKFLNVAPKAWQAKQMYEYIILTSAGTPFEKLIWEKPRRPYHTIILRYQIGEVVYESSLEFMSADRDATGILSWEGDWINIEEAGLLDNLEEVVTSTGSRLRGSVRGRPRLGRLSMISNSWDNTYLWYYFDQAISDPDNYLSLVVSTRHNKNVTPEQLKKIIKRIPENEREQFLDGARPEGKGQYFSKQAIYACEDELLGQVIKSGASEGKELYSLEMMYGVGAISFTTPKREYNEGIYMLLGDPGTGNVPLRNSPVIMLWHVPMDFPEKPCVLSAFWWGSGNGAITPFVNKLLEFKQIYEPAIAAIDSTSSQKNMAEMINLQYLGIGKAETNDTQMVGITGLDFSGTKKSGYLVVARLFIENRLLVWPKFLVGLRSQLTNYDPERDKKIAQDLVATLSMSAYAIRGYFNVDVESLVHNKKFDSEAIEIYERRLFNRDQRSPHRDIPYPQVRA